MSSMFLRNVSKAAILAVLLASTSATAQTNANAGAYLAARAAEAAADFEASARFYRDALRADANNPEILESALTAELSRANFDRAEQLAQRLSDLGINRQISNITRFATAAHDGNWARIFTDLESGNSVGPVVDGLVQGWAHLALGDKDAAISSFDAVRDTTGLQMFGVYHAALAHASTGDFDAAIAVFDGETATHGLRHNRRSAIAHAQILTQLDRRDDALEIIDLVFGQNLDIRLIDLRARIAADEPVAYDVATTPAEGVSEIFLAVSEALQSDTPDDYLLLYARTAQYLSPDDSETILLTADLLENLGRYELATEAYLSVPQDDVNYPVAELGRAEALHDAGQSEAAVEVLRTLIRDFPEMAQAYVALGDTLRAAEDTAAANVAYAQALEHMAPTNPRRWITHYTRAVTYHQLDQWSQAEVDFRAALALRPEQPQILNYLGYSLIERGERLEEALAMIETAVAAQPQNGAIVDSLGWGLFQTGQFEEAVVHLENAAALEAVDPVVNDHLGDAYWAVGRLTEAEFQWHRALSLLKDGDTAADRIRRKLDVGLDAVLIEEGADPIRVADGQP